MPLDEGLLRRTAVVETRVDRLRKNLAEKELPALFVSGLENLRYLSGFTGSAGLGLVTVGDAFFFADPRYHIQARNECRGFEVVPCELRILQSAAEKMKEIGLSTVGVEKNHLTLGQYNELQEHLKDASLTLQATDGMIESLRSIKEPEEVEAIRRACGLVDHAFEQILPFLKEGVTEREVAIELDFSLRRLGADKNGFDSIIAFGPHSAYPHAHPTDRKLERGQFVKMDFGAYMDGYNSDLTRTVMFGPPTDQHREIYEVVKEAQRRAIENLRPGLSGKEADAVARDYIAERGYKDCFGHGLGHSLGREVHDGDRLSPISEITTATGQVWTIEPGVYVEGFGGVRIEDDVVVTENGCEVLTTATKEFIVID